MDKIHLENTEYAVIVGRDKSGSNFVSVYGDMDDNQVAGLARFFYDITRFSMTEANEDSKNEFMELLEDSDEEYDDEDDEE